MHLVQSALLIVVNFHVADADIVCYNALLVGQLCECAVIFRLVKLLELLIIAPFIEFGDCTHVSFIAMLVGTGDAVGDGRWCALTTLSWCRLDFSAEKEKKIWNFGTLIFNAKKSLWTLQFPSHYVTLSCQNSIVRTRKFHVFIRSFVCRFTRIDCYVNLFPGFRRKNINNVICFFLQTLLFSSRCSTNQKLLIVSQFTRLVVRQKVQIQLAANTCAICIHS